MMLKWLYKQSWWLILFLIFWIVAAELALMYGIDWLNSRINLPEPLIPWIDALCLGILSVPAFYGLLYQVLSQLQTQASHQADLFRRNRLMNTLINNLPDLVWMQDADGRYLMCNTAFETFFDVREADILGKTDSDFVAPKLTNFFYHHALGSMELPSASLNGKWVTYALNDSQIILEMRKIAIFDSQGQHTGVLGIGRDVTAAHRSREELELAASVFDHADEAILITDARGTILKINRAFTRITGYEHSDVIGRNPRIFASGQHDSAFYQAMWHDLLTQGNWQGEIINRHKNGALITERLTISAVRNSDGQTRHYVALYTDITDLKNHLRQAEFMARHDVLTGLPNRSLISDHLQRAIFKSQRHGKTLAVAFIDLDGFKIINDQLGHSIGDQVLVITAKRMQMALRAGDILARLGGDEFVAVIEELDEPSACEPIITRILQQAAQPVFIGNLTLHVSASIGISLYPQSNPDISPDQLLRQADHAMYNAKLAGKNRFLFFDEQREQAQSHHYATRNRIRQALENGELVLYYQPKANLRSGEIIGAEALIRWQHPEQGVLPPADFLLNLQYADEQLAIDISRWVIDAALRQIHLWQAQGLALPVSVNVDSHHLQQADFCAQLQTALAAYPELPPGRLSLEILESSALEDLSHITAVITQCQQLGVEIALDDFGTGYSSLAYLKHLPINLLKIDREFVHNMDTQPVDLSILHAVIGIGTAFHTEVIAEGVETAEQGCMLLQLGCRLAQGYGIARPMPAEQIPDWLATWQPHSLWRNQNRLSRLTLPLLFARTEHKYWMARLSAWLSGNDTTSPPLDIGICNLSRWLDDEGRLHFNHLPIVAEIRETHRQLHALANMAIAWRQKPHDPAELSSILEKLEQLTNQLILQLNACIETLET